MCKNVDRQTEKKITNTAISTESKTKKIKKDRKSKP